MTDDTSARGGDSARMTIPVVTECSKALEPVERDPFIDEPQRPAPMTAPAQPRRARS